MQVVLASSNRGKLEEFKLAFAASDFVFISQSHFGIPDADETAHTFLENALLKARHAAKHSGLPALADDSGLCVPALGGAPGIYSARYAGTGSDLDNNLKLLSAMDALEGAARQAYFCCTLVFILSETDPNPLVFQGVWPGEILREMRGNQGFGYNPIFNIPHLNQTAAEISMDQKNELSHRGQAIRQFLFFLSENKTYIS